MSQMRKNKKDDFDGLSSRLIQVSSKSNIQKKIKKSITATPTTILFTAIHDFIQTAHLNNMSEKSVQNGLNELQQNLVHNLSNLATNGMYSDIFGDSFDEFFDIVIQTINQAGEMRRILEENNIIFPDDFNDEK